MPSQNFALATAFNYFSPVQSVWVRIVQLVQKLATVWMVWGWNPAGSEIFLTHPDWPWDPPRLLYNGHQGVKRQGLGVDHPPPSSAEIKEGVELYVCSPSGPSWSVLG